jgi:mRNA-degrading endonuclease RelE of RelBE toxin-antitoxin system
MVRSICIAFESAITRVVYEVDLESSMIVVHYVRHRREVYRALR